MYLQVLLKFDGFLFITASNFPCRPVWHRATHSRVVSRAKGGSRSTAWAMASLSPHRSGNLKAPSSAADKHPWKDTGRRKKTWGKNQRAWEFSVTTRVYCRLDYSRLHSKYRTTDRVLQTGSHKHSIIQIKTHTYPLFFLFQIQRPYVESKIIFIKQSPQETHPIPYYILLHTTTYYYILL